MRAKAISWLSIKGREKAKSLLHPAPLSCFIYAGHAVQQSLHRPQDGIKESLFPCEDPGDEHTERLGHGQNQQEEQCNLQPSIQRHVRTSPDATRRIPGRPSSTRSAQALREFPRATPSGCDRRSGRSRLRGRRKRASVQRTEGLAWDALLERCRSEQHSTFRLDCVDDKPRLKLS